MRAIYLTNVKLAPIKQKLKECEEELAKGVALLNKLNKEKEECDAKKNKLENEAAECQRKKEETQNNLELNKLRLYRANTLLNGLSDEKHRWEEEVKRLRYEGGYLIGASLVAAGMMSYGGPFDSVYRQELYKIWINKINEFKIPLKDDVNLINVIGSKVEIETWKGLYSLPDDDLSIENALMLK